MTEDNRIPEIRAAIADFERYGTNGPRTPGQMLRAVLDILDSAPPAIVGGEPLEPLVSTATTARRRAVHIAQTLAPRVFFPGDTVPAETEVQTKLGNVYRWREDRVLASYFGPVIEVPPTTHEVWQAAVDRAHQARLAEATAQPHLSDPGTGEA